MVDSTRIILSDKGDIEAEKRLVPFAKTQRFILRDLMKFNTLAQDQRIVLLLDESVITVKSVFGTDVINIYSPAQDVVVPGRAGLCAKRKFVFINITESNTIEFYEYDNIAKVTVPPAQPKLVRTIKVNPLINDNVPEFNNQQSRDEAMRFEIMYAEGDLNLLMIYGWVSDWRNNNIDITVEHSLWVNFNTRFPVGLPIAFLGNSDIRKDLVGHFSSNHLSGIPDADIMTFSGLLAFIAGARGAFQGYRAQPLNQFYGYFMNKLLPMTTGNYPYYTTHGYPCLGMYAERMVLGHTTETFTGDYTPQDTAGYLELYDQIFWQGEAAIATVTLTKEKIQNITQIVGYDDKFYVFFANNRTIGNTKIGVTVSVYDYDLDIVKTERAITGITENLMSSVTVISDGVSDFLCFKTANYDLSEQKFVGVVNNSVYLVNPETLELAKTLIVPGTRRSTPFKSFIAVSEPRSCYMLEKINQYRATQPGYTEYSPYTVDYVMPVRYLGYSCRLEACARLHARWLVDNAKMQHEDVSGNKVYDRGVEFGFRRLATGENLAIVDTTTYFNNKQQVDEALRIWRMSPGHNQNLVEKNLTCMGYATAMYPVSTTYIYIGAGQYNPSNGTYSDTATIAPFASSQYGRMKLFVLNVAEG